MKKYYEPGVLLVLKDPQSYQNSWANHVIVLEKPPAEHAYHLFTSDLNLNTGEIVQRLKMTEVINLLVRHNMKDKVEGEEWI